MKRLITVLLGALAAIVAMVALVVPAAQAAPAAPAQPAAAAQPADADANCPANTFCLYTGKNYTGKQINYSGTGTDCRIQGFVDNTSSAINNRDGQAILFVDNACQGRSLSFAPHQRRPDFANAGFNNKANGLKLL